MTRPRDIILFSTADWHSKYWTNKQHIAKGLAARGHRVLYIETVGLRLPGLNARDLKRIGVRLKDGFAPITTVSDGIWRLSPLTIPFGHRSPLVAKANQRHLTSRIRKWMSDRASLAPLVWTYHPYMLDAAKSISPWKIVYHCADNLGAIPGVDPVAFAFNERKLLAQADITFTTSHCLQDKCSALAAGSCNYFGNVADIDHFATARSIDSLPVELRGISGPRIGYVGALSDFKVDFDLLTTIVERRPDWHLILVGDERHGQTDPRLARLLRFANVHALGWRSYSELPRFMAGLDVALLPQLSNDYTQAMFPMKFFEYLAAGLPVVATPLDALRDYHAFHSVASDANGFVSAIDSILGRKHAPPPLADPVIRQNSWDCRLDRMLAVIESDMPR